MNKGTPENLLLVGKVLRPHGVGGLLRIWSYSQSEESFLQEGTIFLKAGPEEFHKTRVITVTPHKNIFLLKLDGLNSSEEAERFRGAKIFIRKAGLRKKEEDEYFWFELIGLKVFSKNDTFLGTLSDILETGGNDIYVVREGKEEFLIPAIHEVIEEIDLVEEKMIVHEMEGLFDLNEV